MHANAKQCESRNPDGLTTKFHFIQLNGAALRDMPQTCSQLHRQRACCHGELAAVRATPLCLHMEVGGRVISASGSETSVSSSTPASAITYDAYTSIINNKLKIIKKKKKKLHSVFTHAASDSG